MTIAELKRFIFENGKIEEILKSIGCHHIKFHPNKDFYSCGNYNGDNTGAINVKNNKYLNVVNWTRASEFKDGSDIITLVQYNKKIGFIEAVKYIHSVLGLEYKRTKIPDKKEDDREDPLWVFKKIKRRRRRINVEEVHAIDEGMLEEYVPLLHIDWFRQGIMPSTREKFGLCYSYRRKRVIIPMRYWLTGELLGINARTTIENYEELGIKKYWLTPSYQKSLNLFGLYENYDAIQKAGYVVVYEAEKSVLKRDSIKDSTGVALSGHTISDEQVRILIGLNVDIIIALDKDVPIEEIWSICERFYRIRNVSYIIDEDDLLDEKDSPADARPDDYNKLFENRIKYGENEHRKYLKCLIR